MNTKPLMTSSAVVLGASGILLTFLPNELLTYLEMEPEAFPPLILQLLGALYFAFAMLNWMVKTALIGGIYNRPVAVANFTHFLIGGLALIKGASAGKDLPIFIWVVSGIYTVFAISFGVLLFRHPIKETSK